MATSGIILTRVCSCGTWLRTILPYLEQENAVRNLNPNTAGDYSTDAPLFRMKIQTFCCPSDNADRNAYNPDPSTGPSFARSNIVGCYGACKRHPPSTTIPKPKRPLFAVEYTGAGIYTYWQGMVSLARVTDGSSNTAAMSEIISGPNGSDDTRGLWWCGAHYEHRNNPNTPNDLLLNPYGHCDPAKIPCTSCNSSGCDTVAASSNHPGGVNLGLADGSVRFVSEMIDNATWQGLASISGGEVIGDY